MRKTLFLRFFLFLIGILTLVFAVKVIADSGNPATITATYNTSTGQLSASGTYNGAPCNDRRVGFALFTNGAIPDKNTVDGLDGTGMHVISDNCTSSGSWADSHVLQSAPETACVVIYDVKLDKSSTGAKTNGSHNISTTTISLKNTLSGIANGDVIKIDNELMKVTAGGGTATLTVIRGYSSSTAATHSDNKNVDKMTPKTDDLIGDGNKFNNDNSYNNNENGYPAGSCVSPTIITPPPPPTPTSGDLCTNLEGFQGTIPDGYYANPDSTVCNAFQYGGAPPPPPAEPTGQVLGASTLGATGTAEANIFYALFTLGSILSGVGIRKFASSKVR